MKKVASVFALPIGAQVDPADGVSYRVWAPDRRTVNVAIGADDRLFRFVRLEREAEGYFSGLDPEGRAGDLYRFQLDGGALVPDPASRFQPQGVFGPSEVIDPASFRWNATAWTRPPIRGRVIYELHVGTFTPEGTFRAALDRLDYLVELGVNTIELMPVADFPGRWNWGYDGVMLYAPARCYGAPDDLRALVDAAHARDLAVVLDVVYNHLGPCGNYLQLYAQNYFHASKDNPWGRSLNFDGENVRPVREFFLSNVGYWIDEYRIDGLRLDATHAVEDESAPHLFAEAGVVAHARGAFAVAENEWNDADVISDGPGGWGLDAVWSDDFHHAVRVALTGQRDAHFRNYTGTTDEIVDSLAHGWIYRGQYFPQWKANRGTEAAHLPPERFVVCTSNHDQVGNRALGDRLHHVVAPEAYRAASALLCFAPYTPLLFMGQEWGASTPFVFFTDHPGEIGENMAKNRITEFLRNGAAFPAEVLQQMPNPQSEMAFLSSKLRWEERSRAGHVELLALYRACLQLRSAEATVFQNPPRARWTVVKLASSIIALRWRQPAGDWLLLVTLTGDPASGLAGDPFVQPTPGRPWRTVLSSNETRFGGNELAPPTLDAEHPGDFRQPRAWLLREHDEAQYRVRV